MRRFYFCIAVVMGIAAICVAKSFKPAAMGPLIAFADRGYLNLAIGRFDPPEKWVPATDYYNPPEPQTVFSIFGIKGKLGEARVADARRSSFLGTFAGWYTAISQWNWDGQPQALAIEGSQPPPARLPTVLPLNDPTALAIAANYLKEKKLSVDSPFLTQAIRIDLLGDGQEEWLVCAHSDASAMRDDQPASVYALALLHFRHDGKDTMLPVGNYAAFKPAHQSLDEFNRYHGERPFYRYVAFVDLKGDGREEISLYAAYSDETRLDIITFDGLKTEKVLSGTHPFQLN